MKWAGLVSWRDTNSFMDGSVAGCLLLHNAKKKVNFTYALGTWLTRRTCPQIPIRKIPVI